MDSHILNVTFCASYKAVLPSEVTNKCIEIFKKTRWAWDFALTKHMSEINK